MFLGVVEEKWYKRAIEGFRKNWARMVRRSESLDAFVAGISAVTGIPEATVRASLPAVHWSEFQKNPEKYLEKAIAKIEAAYRAKKWSVNYKAAFGGS